MSLKSFKLYEYFFSILLTILFCVDSIHKVFFFFNYDPSINLLKCYKGAIFLMILGCYFLREMYESILVVFLLSIFFVVGQIYSNYLNIENLILYTKLIFPLSVLLLFKKVNLSKNQSENIFKVFELFLVINSILIYVGFIFNFELFKSYTNNRFGFNGLLPTSASSSYFACCSLIYLYTKYKRLFFNFLSLFIIISLLLIGTRVVYAFFFVFLLLFFLNHKKINFITAFAFLFFAFFLLYYFIYKHPSFNWLYYNKGLLTSVLSSRDVLFFENILPVLQDKWSLLNYLIGGIVNSSERSQIDLIDVFYMIGLMGLLIYFFYFIKSFISHIELNLFYIIVFLVLLFISFVAGNFYFYPSSVIYLMISRERIKYENTFNKNSKYKYS